MLFVLALFAAATDGRDVCSGLPPAIEPADPATAALYRTVAANEEAAGDLEAAKVAYASALAHDPHDARTRASLAKLCAVGGAAAEATANDEFQRGLDRMTGGDRAAAIAAFEGVRTRSADPAAALLEGICLYEQGNDSRAQPLFEEARSEPKLAGTAMLFLGLIALRADDQLRAAGLFDSAAVSDPRLSSSLLGLSRLAHRDGRLVASARAEVGYDSNVSLIPDGTAMGGGAGDAYTLATAGLFARGLGVGGAFARLIGQYRHQLQIFSYDLGDAGGAVGYRFERTGRSLAGEYGYDFLTLGGASYSSVHHLAADGRTARGPLAMRGTYAARWETFWPSAAAAYSGPRQDVDVELIWQGAGLAAGAGYHLGLDNTRDSALSFVENGAQLLLRIGRAGQSRATLAGAFTARHYDAVDPDFGLRRTDRYFDVAVTGERDLSNHWIGHVAVTARRAQSDVAEFQYTKVTVAVGFTCSGGLL